MSEWRKMTISSNPIYGSNAELFPGQKMGTQIISLESQIIHHLLSVERFPCHIFPPGDPFFYLLCSLSVCFSSGTKQTNRSRSRRRDGSVADDVVVVVVVVVDVGHFLTPPSHFFRILGR